MKRLVPNIYLLSLLIVTFSCTDKDIIDGGGETPTNKKINEWIYETMLDNYLWYEEMPDETKVKNYYNYEPDLFFRELLSRKDGKTKSGTHDYYSSIEKNTATKSYQGDKLSFGFEYQAWNLGNNTLGLQILYIIPDSPASVAGLKRGDWIFTLNGSAVSGTYYDILSTNTSVQIGAANTMKGSITKNVTLTAANVEDHPVYKSNIVEPGVAYLAYNHFTTGPDGPTDYTFDTDLRNAIKELGEQNNVTDFILDLRYNLGGYISSAQVLASALLPANKLDNVFCKMTYNNKQESKNQSLKFTANNHPGLNIQRLFVITSWRTASASELVIAGLEPYMDVCVIGDESSPTEGKNVGSTEYTNNSYDWVLHPIVCHVTNVDEWDYSDGIEATSGFAYSYQQEINDNVELYDLGDPDERVLQSILNYINGNGFTLTSASSPRSAVSSRSTDIQNIQPLRSSLERKATNGVILNLE
ncbi:MAG: S41 family peptidase [Tannerellaceae bacterium]|nr:S41 family peptidase [Tannerellaceae bacterium]